MKQRLGERNGKSLCVHSQMSGGGLGATIGQESQQLGRAGCGMQESEDKLESTGTSMSVVAATNPMVFRELIHFCFPNLKQLSFFTNFNLDPYSCSLTKLTHINSLITIKSFLSSHNFLQWKKSSLSGLGSHPGSSPR